MKPCKQSADSLTGESYLSCQGIGALFMGRSPERGVCKNTECSTAGSKVRGKIAGESYLSCQGIGALFMG